MGKTMEGKVALVTGGSSGIGKATALAFASRGARLVIASRDPEKGHQAECEIKESGAEVIWVQADVSQADQVAALVQRTVDTFGRLDFAFNNGGSGGRGGLLHEIEPGDFDLTISGYLKSVYICMKHEIHVMLGQGVGAIVNCSSVDGLRAFPDDPVYSAAKHGVIGLTRSATLQYANRGVRINAVCPGWIRTPPVDEWIQNVPEIEGKMLRHQPIGRLGRAEEVAEAVVWLCSDQASMILGAILPVDGGYTVI